MPPNDVELCCQQRARCLREEGIDAPLDHIAVRAGVGRATLYRNYPGRREIAEAALTEDLAELGPGVILTS